MDTGPATGQLLQTVRQPILTVAPIADGPERGVHAASTLNSPRRNSFVQFHRDPQAA